MENPARLQHQQQLSAAAAGHQLQSAAAAAAGKVLPASRMIWTLLSNCCWKLMQLVATTTSYNVIYRLLRWHQSTRQMPAQKTCPVATTQKVGSRNLSDKPSFFCFMRIIIALAKNKQY
jgi:hypothetical protein